MAREGIVFLVFEDEEGLKIAKSSCASDDCCRAAWREAFGCDLPDDVEYFDPETTRAAAFRSPLVAPFSETEWDLVASVGGDFTIADLWLFFHDLGWRPGHLSEATIPRNGAEFREKLDRLAQLLGDDDCIGETQMTAILYLSAGYFLKPSASELCRRAGVQIWRVGDIYDADEQGNPIPASDLEKLCVTVPADTFPTDFIRSIPLATTRAEAETLAVEYLQLR